MLFRSFGGDLVWLLTQGAAPVMVMACSSFSIGYLLSTRLLQCFVFAREFRDLQVVLHLFFFLCVLVIFVSLQAIRRHRCKLCRMGFINLKLGVLSLNDGYLKNTCAREEDGLGFSKDLLIICIFSWRCIVTDKHF